MGRDGRATSHTIATVGQSRGVTLADVNRDGTRHRVPQPSDQSRRGTARQREGRLHQRRPDNGRAAAPGCRRRGPQSRRIRRSRRRDHEFDVARRALWQRSGAFTRRSFFAGRQQNVLGVADIDLDGWLDAVVVSTATARTTIMQGDRVGPRWPAGPPPARRLAASAPATSIVTATPISRSAIAQAIR